MLDYAAASQGDTVVYPPKYIREHCIRMQYHELLVKFRTRAQTIKKVLHVRAGSITRLHLNRQLDDIEWFWAVIMAGRLPALSTSLVNDHGQRRKHLIQLHGFLPDPII